MNYSSQHNGLEFTVDHRRSDSWSDSRSLSGLFPHGIPTPVRVKTSFVPNSRQGEQLELRVGNIILVEKVNYETNWCFGRLLEIPSLMPGWFPAVHLEPLETITVPTIAPRGLSEGLSLTPPPAGIGVAFALAGPHRLLVSILQPGKRLLFAVQNFPDIKSRFLLFTFIYASTAP